MCFCRRRSVSGWKYKRQHSLDIWKAALKESNMRINTGKSKAIEMKYLRRVKGVTRNEAIREKLRVEPVLKLIEQSQLRLTGLNII
nr:unnamed protein product [Callosobruchus analis]